MLRSVVSLACSLAVVRSPSSGYCCWEILSRLKADARGLEVVGDVLLLLLLLVGVDHQRLNERPATTPRTTIMTTIQPTMRVQRPAPAAAPHVDEQHDGQAERDHEGHAGAGQARVHVGVAGAGDHAGRRVEQLPGAEQRAQGADREDQAEDAPRGGRRPTPLGRETTSVGPRATARRRGATGCGPSRRTRPPGVDRCTTRPPSAAWVTTAKTSDAISAPDDDRVEQVPERQLEDVERVVVAEERVVDPPRDGVQRASAP